MRPVDREERAKYFRLRLCGASEEEVAFARVGGHGGGAGEFVTASEKRHKISKFELKLISIEVIIQYNNIRHG